MIAASPQWPLFIGIHFFACRTALEDVAKLVSDNEREQLHFVRADEILVAARQY